MADEPLRPVSQLQVSGVSIFPRTHGCRAACETKFNLLFSQHAISAVAAGKLKRKIGVPVVMNFPDLLTGFMETWPGYSRRSRWFTRSCATKSRCPCATAWTAFAPFPTNSPTGSPRAAIRAKESARFITATTPKNFRSGRSLPREKPPVIVMHGSFDAHHLGPIAFDAIQFVTRQRPGIVFRFVGKKTAALEKFLNRAQTEISGFKFEATDFVPYAEVASHLADASVGIVPYEESAGTHCAFVAKVVEYVASGLPAVSTPLKSIRRYFQNDPMVRFSKFDGEDFGKEIIGWLDEPPKLADLRREIRRARPGRAGLASALPQGGGFCGKHFSRKDAKTQRFIKLDFPCAWHLRVFEFSFLCCRAAS